jgi:malonate transporter and related proteins
MIEILNIALPFFGLILLGGIAGKIWARDEEGLAWLNIFVLYFAIPALIFLVIAATPFEKLVNPVYVMATAGATTLCFLLMWFLARNFFNATPKHAALMGTAAAYGNVGYMGLPLAVAFFGQQAAVPAALVFAFDCTVLFILTAMFATKGAGLSTVAKDVFTHPFNVATIVGVIASAAHWMPTGGVLTILEMLKEAAGPVALFAMGVTVSLRGKPTLDAPLATLTAIKLALHPLLAFAAVGLFVAADETWLQVAIMMAALPTAGNAFILARQNNAFITGAGHAVIITTAVSVVTIPLLVYALQML